MTLIESYPQMSIFKKPWQVVKGTLIARQSEDLVEFRTKSLFLTSFSNLDYSIILQSCQLPVKKGSINGLHVIKLPTNFVRLYKRAILTVREHRFSDTAKVQTSVRMV